MARKIAIDPVTRIEGHAKVTIHLDDNNRIRETRFHVVEFRGFERFVQGRLYWEVPVIVQRLCGICPVSHLLAAAKAMDGIVGVDKLPVTAEKMRRLMHYGQVFQSHCLHVFYLAAPDLLLGFDASPAVRNVVGLAIEDPELVKRAIKMRKFGQEVIRLTAGKRIHGTSAIPGGINKNLSLQERDELLADAEMMVQWSREALELFKNYYRKDQARLSAFAAFESNFVSLVREDGALDLYDGRLRAKNADGGIIFDMMRPMDYLDFIREGVRAWSYMKFPFIRALGPELGWYRVGPLARLNNCDFIDTPLAESERVEFLELGAGRPVHATMAYHWARMIETVHAAEKIQDLLNDPDLQGSDLIARGDRRPESVALLEAPRGTLFHHYRVGSDDRVERANLIVSTTSNNEPMNRAVRRVAEDYLEGVEITEGLLNRIEVGIRAFDPCLSCATHASMQVAISASVVGHDGRILSRKERC